VVGWSRLNAEMEATLAALNAASESVRAACHAGYSAPASPDSLYIRGGVLVEVLDRLRQVAFTLGNHAERAATEAAASGCVLETDDGTPASDYAYDARRPLADVAAGIDETTRIASEAHNVLSHPKLTEPPQ
jgi:hypothetical protein